MRGGRTYDEIVDALPKCHKERTAEETGGDDRRNPADVFLARPGEPEQRNRQDDGTDDHGW